MEEVARACKSLLESLKSNIHRISLAILLCFILLATFLALLNRSYGVSCADYCPATPHAACVGYWNISGSYPNCDCRYTCWSSRTCAIDSDCQSGETCYRSIENGQDVGDMLCHPICTANSDCPKYAPYCRRVSITIGSYSNAVDMCMSV
jgi:hypothetical protein